MAVDMPFMPWIDHLPDVGDPIRCERSRLLELSKQATELERHAAALRIQVHSGRTALLMKVMNQWSLAEIQVAAQSADREDPLASMCAHVEDAALRERLQSLDGWHLASEALQAFDAADVIRQHNLLSTASEEERRQTLARVLAWWNHAARPVCERLAME